ncbi:MAG: DUF2283 domain-containing protein [Planctomycetaceae bacterium]
MKTAQSDHSFNVSFEVNHQTGEVLAAYFRIRKGHSVETREFAQGAVFADYNRDGNLLGIEMLAPCKASVLNKIAAPEPTVKKFLKRASPRELVTP